MTKTKSRKLLAALLSLALVFALLPAFSQSAFAATLTFTDEASLRAAIAAAADGDTVESAAVEATTIGLTEELLVDKNITIDGKGFITLDGGGVCRTINHTVTDGLITLKNLTIQNSGKSSIIWGGSVYSMGTISAFNCNFINNFAYRGGGALCAEVEVITNDCIFTGNKSDEHGGAVNSKIVSATNCTFTNNTAKIDGGGFWAKTSTLTDCTFTSNISSSGSGGGFISQSATVSNCTFTGNKAVDGSALKSLYVVLANSVFSLNKTTNTKSGALFIRDASDIIHCTVVNNIGNGVYYYNANTILDNLYILNSVVAGNSGASLCTVNLNVFSDITNSGNILGNNLIEGRDGLTTDDILGTNTVDANGVIYPKKFFTAAPITAAFESGSGLTDTEKADLITLLAADRFGTLRDSAAVTYGALEAIPDFDALEQAIADAQKVLDEADIGTEPGQYPQDAADALQQAIDAAHTVLDNPGTTAFMVTTEIGDLEKAVDAFNDSVNPELEPEPEPEPTDGIFSQLIKLLTIIGKIFSALAEIIRSI